MNTGSREYVGNYRGNPRQNHPRRNHRKNFRQNHPRQTSRVNPRQISRISSLTIPYNLPSVPHSQTDSQETGCHGSRHHSRRN